LPSTRFPKPASLIVGAGLLTLCAAASAAGPALPKAASAYSTGGNVHGVSLTLVTSASSGKKLEMGQAALGSQFAMSGGAIDCKKAKKGPGFHEVPFAVFGFPATTLKVSNGRYGFSKSIKQKGTVAAGSTGKQFTLKLKVVGTVVRPSLIEGTITAKGGPCATKKAVKYRAKLDPKLPVAPGL
jgi:hypothetical protein